MIDASRGLGRGRGSRGKGPNGPDSSGRNALPQSGTQPGRDRAQDAPASFTRAISQAPRIVDVDRGGRFVRACRWGDPRGYPVVLLHGARAGGHSWDHVAPQLVASGLQVVAVELVGHGGSDYCEEYTLTGWAEDVMAVCSQLSPDRPVLIGHSAGGRAGWKAAEKHGSGLRTLVTVDSPMPPPAPQHAPGGMFARQREGHHVYTERRARAPVQAIAQAGIGPAVRSAHIAERSVRQVADGWTWAYDIKIRQGHHTGEIQAGPLGRPLYVLVAEHGTRNAGGGADVRGAVAAPDDAAQPRACRRPTRRHH